MKRYSLFMIVSNEEVFVTHDRRDLATLEQEKLRWESLHPPTMDMATKQATGSIVTEGTKRNDKRIKSRGIKKVFRWEDIEELAHANNLCATGPSLQEALRSNGGGSAAGRCERFRSGMYHRCRVLSWFLQMNPDIRHTSYAGWVL